MASAISPQIVAARTRAAQCILTRPELLALFQSFGGLASDLERIRDAGLEVEAQELAKSTAAGGGVAATADVMLHFAEVQKEYVAVMGVVRLVRQDHEDAGKTDIVAALQQIIKNEARVTVRTVQSEEGKTERVASRSTSTEALRAEILKDARALVGLPAVHEALAARKVPVERLKKLEADADALSEKLSDRATKKGATKTATAAKSDAVQRQAKWWGAAYRILAMVGEADAQVAELLREAARSRARKA
ncbi:hypothetical protein [Polyangium jinanense]|uniref:Uncharacterized protein n=1 Tax=Polyangium jinanense TaxID=2829994 RepID=A0A9X4ARD5_9BACT|nr:hypothetical protein [Polyangium jinanense]MDC3954065.1 hypothetical protein [Polyangium jinanense]MDC3981979.1 hypothetical protein [Polyangium jinanense]